ncbi:Metal-dependent hydrolase, endonuclease/exonuclease/phosphatase family [Flavimobilis marinus]|uniref:Metal-dependent hydrolase, endonuclease/exonuclease/phosphatase family n=1 Tax=Flavimobilis marinus TaxID=285351 RepID=A0A1I2H057_9MICO|nr:endonuclease/exonuclease/phosphatase family protein [Flavimobilis marinus]SFF22131.1 Metal-dependent hydrolase, endonuclease/exonuclease/phosphatase family [Flavimobilis marinus]
MRVLSYNVKGLQLDRDAIVAVIRSADPDVLLLQEAPRGPWGPRRTRRLARDVGLVAVVAGWRGRGAAIAVRPELAPHVAQARGVVIESRLARFRRGWPTPRGYAVVRLRAPGQEPTTFASVHMSALPAQRARHLPAYRRLVGTGAERLVLGGDLNENPGGPTWVALCPPLRDASPDNTDKTMPARTPRHRLDAFLVGPQIAPGHVAVLGGALVERASDHRPVLMTLTEPPHTSPHP